METILIIGNLIAIAMIVLAVAGTVWKESDSPVLSAFVTLAILIFAMVSLLVSSGLAERSSSSMQALQLAVLVVIALLVRSSWASESTLVRK